jgi:uncharacterized protein YjiS (DUF1127 family)
MRSAMKKISEYMRLRRAMNELYAMSDKDLADIGLERYDIPRAVRSGMRSKF